MMFHMKHCVPKNPQNLYSVHFTAMPIPMETVKMPAAAQNQQKMYLVMTVLKGPSGSAYRFFASEKEQPGAWLVKEGPVAAVQAFPKSMSGAVSDCKISAIGAIEFGILGKNATLQSIEQDVFFPGQYPSSASKAQELQNLLLGMASAHLKGQGVLFSSVSYDKENPMVLPGLSTMFAKPVAEPAMA
jgi:hypothetical protein